MILLDTNVFIYFANGTLDSRKLIRSNIAYATITKVEALGYPKIQMAEMLLLEAIFNAARDIPLTDDIIRQAIALRQSKHMQLGDAIIAATAMVHQLELWTANIDDFCRLDGINVVNPLDNVTS